MKFITIHYTYLFGTIDILIPHNQIQSIEYDRHPRYITINYFNKVVSGFVEGYPTTSIFQKNIRNGEEIIIYIFETKKQKKEFLLNSKSEE